MSRFQQLYDYIEREKPKVVLELGTWNGQSAKHMFSLGIEKYIGFDVWDEGTEELDEIENNVKKHATKEGVAKLLDGKDVELIQGNTRRTFSEYVKDKTPFVDLVIIDGGHSYSTIKSDFLGAIRIANTDGSIFLDDYYFGCPDPKIGANLVMGELNVPYKVLPKVDKAKGGYTIKLCQVEMKYVPRKDWDMPEESSWRFEP